MQLNKKGLSSLFYFLPFSEGFTSCRVNSHHEGVYLMCETFLDFIEIIILVYSSIYVYCIYILDCNKKEIKELLICLSIFILLMATAPTEAAGIFCFAVILNIIRKLYI